MLTKHQLRLKYKSKRKKLSADDIEAKSMEIANRLINEPVWDYSNYHLFLPIRRQKEVNTEFLISALQGHDKNIILSATDFETYTMKHFLLTDDTLIKENKMGIPEPLNGFEISEDYIDVVFLPLLAFDKLGNRIGYGKGFYDKFLSKCKNSMLKIGLSFFEAEDEIPAHKNDVRLDACQTPERMYWF
ncbi:MAG: 5-formyltetrahydrofolate cyclo-ligase [Psychroflexus sp.]|nr:5-formyltetrahydrofolate cyclo-ligase [Psychroflexus sp.]MDR9449355.1 5-formyltetrahydrofolate cyclo-ligase [Psychroflexus sp.]